MRSQGAKHNMRCCTPQLRQHTSKNTVRARAGDSLLSLNGRREPSMPKGKEALARSLSAANASLAAAGKRTSPLERSHHSSLPCL